MDRMCDLGSYSVINLIRIMEDSQILDSYRLDKLRVVINHKNPSFSCPIQKDQSISKEQFPPTVKPNLITIQSKITLREPLNHCLKSKAEVMKVWIKNKCIAINFITKQGAVSFSTMNYYSFLEVLPGGFAQQATLSIEQVQTIPNATTISFKVNIYQQGNLMTELFNNSEIWVQFGSKNWKNVAKLEVSSFTLNSINTSKPPTISASKLENRFQFIDYRFSLPLGVISSAGQVYEIMSSPQSSLTSLETVIRNLPAYQCPADKQSHLYLCHDMKGGYIQDVVFEKNTRQGIKPCNLDYRALHLQQAEVFNYFSHYNITIPPLHWRLACRTAQTKCLGTFIIEHPVFQEGTLCSAELALLLVGIAKKCGFDGYLLNIQTKVSSISAFKKWVGILTAKMHEHIPGSLIIWYDSISQHDGQIKYQNALTNQNYQFYHLTDGIFTNYWWNQELLRKTSQLKNNNPKRVYIGNDCFGRNTYAGGMYNIYKAVNKVLQFKNDLSIAIFAPAYTYQDNGELIRKLFHLNELALYKGIKSQAIVVDRWKNITKAEGWKKEGDWTATSYELCERSALFNFPPLEKGSVVNVQFMVQVMGTPPIADSPYKVILQVVAQSGEVLHQSDSSNFNNYRKTTEVPQLQSFEVAVGEQLVGTNPYGIKVIEMGKCREHWAGHFGPRFKGQKVFVLIYEKQRHWISKIPVRQVRIGSPFHSFCNAGTGDHFYYYGQELQDKYGFLADFDLPHTHIINHPFDTQLNQETAFVGGSSLTIKKQTVKLLKIIIPKGLDLKKEYYVQVTTKNTPQIQLILKYISKNEEERIFAAKSVRTQEINGWKRFTFRLVTTLGEVKADIRSIIDIVSSKYPYQLGEINIFQRKQEEKKAVEVILTASRDEVPTTFYYLNALIESTTHKRLLLLIEKYGAFAYFQAGRASLLNIPVPKCQSFNVKIIDVDSGLEPIVIRDYPVESWDIATLVMHGQIKI